VRTATKRPASAVLRPADTPILPNEGTHAEAMLIAIAAAYPDTSWNPRYSRMKGHSRVADLRILGWEIEHVYRGSQHGYRMLTHCTCWPRKLRRIIDQQPVRLQQSLEVAS
jgi:hypothetical protein